MHIYNIPAICIPSKIIFPIILNSYDSNGIETYSYINILVNFKDTDSQKGMIHCHSFLSRSNQLYKTPNIVYRMNQIQVV